MDWDGRIIREMVISPSYARARTQITVRADARRTNMQHTHPVFVDLNVREIVPSERFLPTYGTVLCSTEDMADMPAEAVALDLNVGDIEKDDIAKAREVMAELGFHTHPHDDGPIGGIINYQPFGHTNDNIELVEECAQRLSEEFPDAEVSYEIRKNRDAGEVVGKRCYIQIETRSPDGAADEQGASIDYRTDNSEGVSDGHSRVTSPVEGGESGDGPEWRAFDSESGETETVESTEGESDERDTRDGAPEWRPIEADIDIDNRWYYEFGNRSGTTIADSPEDVRSYYSDKYDVPPEEIHVEPANSHHANENDIDELSTQNKEVTIGVIKSPHNERYDFYKFENPDEFFGESWPPDGFSTKEMADLISESDREPDITVTNVKWLITYSDWN